MFNTKKNNSYKDSLLNGLQQTHSINSQVAVADNAQFPLNFLRGIIHQQQQLGGRSSCLEVK